MFTIAGHRFRKLGSFTSKDKCTYCNKLMDAFLTQGHKCSGKCLFCIQFIINIAKKNPVFKSIPSVLYPITKKFGKIFDEF